MRRKIVLAGLALAGLAIAAAIVPCLLRGA
jgi:hypothetical protein